ncbi:MAG TPA: hypothetical protein VHS59_11085, partial [Bacillota bacterium]|nr:hypothetical protein [Bacillota bacterium]
MFKRLTTVVLMISLAMGLTAGCQNPARKPLTPNNPLGTAEQPAPSTRHTWPRISAVQYPSAPP